MRITRFDFATEYVTAYSWLTVSISSVQTVRITYFIASPVLSSTNLARVENYALDWDLCHPVELKPKTPADWDDHMGRKERDPCENEIMTTDTK